MWNFTSSTIAILVLPCAALAQPDGLLIDRVIAVVGREAILHSDLVGRTEQARQNGAALGSRGACGELEDLLYEKLLLEQGRLDSVVVDEAQLDSELDRRIRYFAAQLGGEEELEKFYGKSVTDACLGWEDTVETLDVLADAVRKRRAQR